MIIKQDNFIEYYIRLALIVEYAEKCFGGQLNANLVSQVGLQMQGAKAISDYIL